MPLLTTTLTQALLNLDVPQPPANPTSTAKKWFDAWWVYASGMVYLNPGTLAAARGAAMAPFLGALTPACAPSPVPGVFFLALEAAMRAAWLVLSTPAFLMPPVTTAIPAPAPFAPMALAIVPVGLASPDKTPPRVMLATTIDAWTRMHIAMVTVPAPAPAGPFS